MMGFVVMTGFVVMMRFVMMVGVIVGSWRRCHSDSRL